MSRRDVKDLQVGDVVKMGAWRCIEAIEEITLGDFKVTYRKLYLDNGDKIDYNIYETLEVC